MPSPIRILVTQFRVVERDAGMCKFTVSWIIIFAKSSSQISVSDSKTVKTSVCFWKEGDSQMSLFLNSEYGNVRFL